MEDIANLTDEVKKKKKKTAKRMAKYSLLSDKLKRFRNIIISIFPGTISGVTGALLFTFSKLQTELLKALLYDEMILRAIRVARKSCNRTAPRVGTSRVSAVSSSSARIYAPLKLIS